LGKLAILWFGEHLGLLKTSELLRRKPQDYLTAMSRITRAQAASAATEEDSGDASGDQLRLPASVSRSNLDRLVAGREHLGRPKCLPNHKIANLPKLSYSPWKSYFCTGGHTPIRPFQKTLYRRSIEAGSSDVSGS